MKTWATVLITIIVSAGVAGGGTYYYLNKKATTDKNNLQSQIDELNAKLSAPAMAPTVDPATTVTSFYNWWNNDSIDHSSLISAPGFSQDLQTWYNSALSAEGNNGGGVDPVTCAQDTPPSFTAETLSKDSGSTEVQVTENFTPAVVLTVGVKANGNLWQLESVTCPSS